jgi:hypothetical protein
VVSVLSMTVVIMVMMRVTVVVMLLVMYIVNTPTSLTRVALSLARGVASLTSLATSATATMTGDNHGRYTAGRYGRKNIRGKAVVKSAQRQECTHSYQKAELHSNTI